MIKFDISNNPTILNKYNDGSGKEYSEGIEALAAAFKASTTITELSLSELVGRQSKAGPKVAAFVADILKNNGALSSLDLSDNGIPADQLDPIERLCESKQIALEK